MRFLFSSHKSARSGFPSFGPSTAHPCATPGRPKDARRVCAMDGAHQNQCLIGIDFSDTSPCLQHAGAGSVSQEPLT